MPWRNGRYYVRNKRLGRRIVTEYVGAGYGAELVAQCDQLEQEERQQARIEALAAREAFRTFVQAPAELVTYSEAVRGVIADVLQRLGFHQHKRQWRMKRMTTALEPTAQRARDLFCREKLSADERRELRGILSEQTALARTYGDMARVAW